MDEIIQIKCPFDGAILSVRHQPGIEGKNVTCPICKHKYPFTQFKRVSPGAASPGFAPSCADDEPTSYAFKGASADSEADANSVIGRLLLAGTDTCYQLQPGRNVIGRRGRKSEADFQIDTGDRRTMSREHVVVDVRRVPEKGFVHYVSLFKEKVNPTSIGSEPLYYGDSVILAHGDVIHLPDADLLFEIPDDEATEI